MANTHPPAPARPTPASNGGFWHSWPLRLATLIVAIRLIGPRVPPILRNIDARLHNGWGRATAVADAALWWLSRQVRSLLLLTLFVGSTSGFLLVYGLAMKSRPLVAASGILWVVYLIVLWIILKASVAALRVTVGRGIELIGAALMAVLKKVGLADGEGNAFAVDFKSIDEALRKGFVVLPAFAEMFFLLALIPSWGTFLLCGIVALGAIASGLISAHIGDSTVDGWRLVNRINFYLLIVLGTVAFLMFFFPQSFGKWMDPGALDAWLADPSMPAWGLGFWGTILVTLAIGAGLWVLTACIKGDVGSRLGAVVILATIIAIGVGGYRTWGSSKSHKVDSAHIVVTDGENAVVIDAERNGNRIDFVATLPASSMTMPDMDYKPGGSEPSRGSVNPAARPTKTPARRPVRVTVPKVTAKKHADGLDSVRQNNAEIEALLGI